MSHLIEGETVHEARIVPAAAGCGLILLLVIPVRSTLWGQESRPAIPADELATDMLPELPKFNIDSKTLGGMQFWGDVAFFRGWRIQHNVFTSHYRLLDPDDVRRAWGTLEECRQALEKFKRQQNLPPMSGKAAILIHGIVRTSKSFRAMSQRLQDDGYTVVGFDYPSTRVNIAESAAYLKQVLDSLEGIDQVDIVVHSMGGLLVRTYLLEQNENRDPRLHRMVMLGVPNRGARLANMLQKNLLYQWIYGPAGQQLVEEAEGFIASLPVPDFAFAVIAGGRGTPYGWNPLIPGDDDGTVTVECTRLPGAADFLVLPVTHTFMMNDPEVIDATLRFFNTGSLRISGERKPIEAGAVRAE